MRRILIPLFTTLLFAFANTANAQKSKLILGEWTYSEPIGKEKMDAKTQELMDAFFSTMWFSFKSDGTYTTAAMDKEENGKWKLDAAGKVLTLTPSEGEPYSLTVIDVTATTWLMEIEPGKGFKLIHGTRKKE